MVLVQGDTTTTLCGALAAFYSKVPGGPRGSGPADRGPVAALSRGNEPRADGTHDRSALCRHRAARRATWRTKAWSAPSIHVTGNSGIDAVLHVKEGLEDGSLAGS